jgi:hypothetical protein
MAAMIFQRPSIAVPAEAMNTDSLYDRDYYAWTRQQADLLRAKAAELSFLDPHHLAEEIDSLGRSEQREIESRLAILVLHLLKWRFQSDRRSRSWQNTIREQRSQIQRELKVSPSLRSYPAETLVEDYWLIRAKTADETNLSEDVFPAECPFTIDEILDPEFYPDAA